MAHVRRKFFDATKESKTADGAHIALMKIQKIYHYEGELCSEELSDEEFLLERRARVVPLVEDLKSFLDEVISKIEYF